MKRWTRVRLVLLALLALGGAPPAGAADEDAPQPVSKARWSLGAALLYVEGGEIPARISGSNPADVAVRGGDDTRAGLRLGASRGLTGHWDIELAYVDLGDAVAFVGGQGANAEEVLEAAEDLQAQSGYGFSLGALRRWDPAGPVRLELGGGLWAWRSEWSLGAGGRSRDYHRTGADLYATAAASMAVGDRLRLRARWDRYRLDGGDADSFGLELLYRLD